jgi:ribosomal protein S18 acetylase RimI-like enzyme
VKPQAAYSWQNWTALSWGSSRSFLASHLPNWTPGHYALVTDLVVLEPYRGRGIGCQLLRRAEAFIRDAGASELRIGVLADNRAARRLYLDAAFVPHLEILVKRWSKYSNAQRGLRFSMMEIEDKRNQMGAAVGLRYRIGQSGTPAAK